MGGGAGDALLTLLGPLKHLGVRDAELSVATTGKSVTVTAKGSPHLGADGCQGVLACALARLGESVVRCSTAMTAWKGGGDVTFTST